MSVAVAPLPQLNEPNDSTALARKRRREILLSHRACVPDLPPSNVVTTEDAFTAPPLKKQKVTHEVSEESDSSDSQPQKKVAVKKTASKKPQMRYDPDVPMTKEEAAVWRREQRRKRNRESAAASRQRQRDRIVELEVELDDWKDKFNDMMERIHKLEELTQTNVTDNLMAEIEALEPQTYVSPTSSPNLSPCQSPTASPVASYSFVDTGMVKAERDLQVHEVEEESEEQLLSKMISRPA